MTGVPRSLHEVSASAPVAAFARNVRRSRLLFEDITVCSGPLYGGLVCYRREGVGAVVGCVEAVRVVVPGCCRAANPARARLLFGSRRKMAWYSSCAGGIIPRKR